MPPNPTSPGHHHQASIDGTKPRLAPTTYVDFHKYFLAHRMLLLDLRRRQQATNNLKRSKQTLVLATRPSRYLQRRTWSIDAPLQRSIVLAMPPQHAIHIVIRRRRRPVNRHHHVLPFPHGQASRFRPCARVSSRIVLHREYQLSIWEHPAPRNLFCRILEQDGLINGFTLFSMLWGGMESAVILPKFERILTGRRLSSRFFPK